MYYSSVISDGNDPYVNALKYHNMASEKNSYSRSRVAFMMRRGMGCKFDYSESIKASDSAAKDNSIAKMEYARYYFEIGNFKKVVELYDSMTETNPMAEYTLGLIYKSGALSEPPEPDYFKALYHFHNAVNSEMPVAGAAVELGQMFFNGFNNFRRDYKLAEHYFKIASELGDAHAKYMLGFMAEFGMVKKDIKKAIDYFLESEKRGEIWSSYNLAMLYQENEFKNYHKAFKHAQLSADNGSPAGMYILANMLFFGRGCEPNITKAKEYYLKALLAGEEQAQMMIDRIEKIEKTESMTSD